MPIPFVALKQMSTKFLLLKDVLSDVARNSSIVHMFSRNYHSFIFIVGYESRDRWVEPFARHSVSVVADVMLQVFSSIFVKTFRHIKLFVAFEPLFAPIHTHTLASKQEQHRTEQNMATAVPLPTLFNDNYYAVVVVFVVFHHKSLISNYCFECNDSDN